MDDTVIDRRVLKPSDLQFFPANTFPTIHPVFWLHSHFAVGGWSPLQRLSGMLTAHMTRIKPHNGFAWHPHRGLEIYTWVLEGTLYHEDTTGGKGEISVGELQRMFSGDWIEHQELNLTDKPVRVIQIWYLAEPHFRGRPPHYQQLTRDDLPRYRVDDAWVSSLIGDGSPMEQHMRGRLTATTLDADGNVGIQLPEGDMDLFLYVTDGSGHLHANGESTAIGQYDVLLANPEAEPARLEAGPDEKLDYLSFYLPSFLP